MQPLDTPHDMTACYGSRLHCMIHCRDEPDTGAYWACGECWHVYPTEAALVAAHNTVMGEMAADAARHGWEPFTGGMAVTGAEVFCCPFCAHDW